MLMTFVKLGGLSLSFLLHCGILGFAALDRLQAWPQEPAPDWDNGYLRWFFALSVGLTVNIAVLFVLGLTALLGPGPILGIGVALLAASAFSLLRTNRLRQTIPWRWESAGALTLALLFAVTIFSAMHAPGVWDDTMYQLPLARFYLQHHQILVHEYLRFPLFPQNMNLVVALGIMLSGELGAQTLATLPLFVMGIGLLGAARWLTGSILLGALASAILFMIGPVESTLGYAYIDNGLALFCWAASLAVAIWAQSEDRSRPMVWVVVAGLSAGGASGTKYFGLVFAMVLGLYLLVRRDWKAAGIFSAMILLTGSWWYIRSYLISGDPIHPAGGNVFGHYLWNASDLIIQKQEQASHGVPPGTLNVWAALKVAQVQVWALALAGLLFRRQPAPVRSLQFTFVGYFAFWFFVTQVDRYLAPIYALGTLLSGYTLYQVYRWASALLPSSAAYPRAKNILSVLLILLVLWPMATTKRRRARKAMRAWQATLESRPGYRLFAQANALIPDQGERIVQIGFENAIYFFEGTAIGDRFGPGRYRQMIESRYGVDQVIAPERMKALMERFSARMLAVSTRRFPGFDKDAFASCFDTIMTNEDGVLLTLKR